jgi:hypothetical protein
MLACNIVPFQFTAGRVAVRDIVDDAGRATIDALEVPDWAARGYLADAQFDVVIADL